MSAAARLLDGAFHALSNVTRRAIVKRLGAGSATVSELAQPFDMALPSFLQHLRVLESSGLVTTRKQGRVRTVRLRTANLKRAVEWLAQQQALWERRLGQLDDYLRIMEDQDV
ncbi:MAG: helix-turn-helix transcriptional regulator [Planctomycetes bacterium]|nr:helix-turn-helix transcriptional regulator [Planctomycetota bacterium]